MASSRSVYYKVYNQYNNGKFNDEDILQYCLALISDYCETETEVKMVRWLQTVGLQHRDMKVNTPKDLLKSWMHHWCETMVGDAIQRIMDWRRDPKKSANKILTDTYHLIETHQWGIQSKKDFYKLQGKYYKCLTVGKEITQPIPAIMTMIEVERTSFETLACASDEVEAAGFGKSAKHLRCNQKHLWNCSVFKGILGTA